MPTRAGVDGWTAPDYIAMEEFIFNGVKIELPHWTREFVGCKERQIYFLSAAF